MHQQSHLRFRWNRIFKRFHHDDENRQQTNNLNTEKDQKYPQRITRRLQNIIEDENDQSHSKLSPSFESLPFADPSLTKAAFSDENLSFDQEKFIEQNEFCSTSSSPTDKHHSQSIERTSMINPVKCFFDELTRGAACFFFSRTDGPSSLSRQIDKFLDS